MKLQKIKTLLYLKNIKSGSIAKIAGVSAVTVRVVLNGHGKSHRVQQAVADLLCIPYERLWNSTRNHTAILTNNKKAVND